MAALLLQKSSLSKPINAWEIAEELYLTVMTVALTATSADLTVTSFDLTTIAKIAELLHPSRQVRWASYISRDGWDHSVSLV